MKSNLPFQVFKNYCLRTPTLPIAFLHDLINAQNITASIKEILQDAVIREAIYLASPELFKQIELWEQNKITNPKKKDRIQNTVLKYIVRMSSRCTPFGLFAGCSVGEISDGSIVKLDNNISFSRNTKYDMHFLASLAQNFAKRNHIKEQLHYYPNSTLYRLGNRYRYIEYIYENKKRVHNIESVLHLEYLEEILNKAKNGTTIKSLVTYLISDGIDKVDANAFINELIDNQILVSELEPTITGKDFLKSLQDRLKNLKSCDPELNIISNLLVYQDKLSNGKTQNLATYKAINTYVSSINIDFEPKYLLQTDIYPKLKANTISNKTVHMVKSGVHILNSITKKSKNINLENFKSAFNKRYEHQKKPLLEVLDIESGIGYANRSVSATPFLDDIKIPYQKNSVMEELSPFQELLLTKLQECLLQENTIIALTNEDLKLFDANWENTPDTLSVMTEILCHNGKEKVFMGSASAHASRLLARFASGDKQINTLTDEIVKKETLLNSDSILAEIVHIPESRTGNILRRPHLRAYEIPCLGFSSLPLENQISLDDILVSIEYGKIILTQVATGKQILLLNI